MATEPVRTQPTIRFGGDFELDPRVYELRRGGRALWKDADPDIPILKDAKAEYAKLQ